MVKAAQMIESPWADTSTLETATFDHLLDMQDNLPVTRSRAMKLPVVAKSRRIIATNIGKLPLIAYGPDDAPLDSQPLFLTQPEPGLARVTTLTWTADALMFYPFAFWQITSRDYQGFPKSVRWVPNDRAEVNESGQLVRAFGERVAANDSIRFDSPDNGLLTDANDVIRRALRLNTAAANAEDNPVPAVDLHNEGDDMTDDEIDTMIARWQRARRGSGVGYSSRSLTVNTLSSPPENLLIAGRREIILELARAAGVPAWAVDAPLEGSSMNYQNRASRNRELIDTALSPYMEAITGRLSMNDITPRGHTVRFATDSMTRPEAKERYEAYKVAIDSGLMTVDEARAKEDLPPIGDSDSENDS
jgi:phage portal protein BeeE